MQHTQTYRIMTDSACDLDAATLARMEIPCVPLQVNFMDAPSQPCTLLGTAFYRALEAGRIPCTAAANLSVMHEAMEAILRQGEDVLYLAFSSAMSCMYHTGCIVAEELRAAYPDRKIVVLDTRSGSLGQGLLVCTAAAKQAEGMSLAALTEYLTQQRMHTIHWCSVDDLMFLRRGGRLGGLSALTGTLLGIKPVMYVGDDGQLRVHAKVRGKKNLVQAFAKHYGAERLDTTETVYIAHANAPADAESLREMLQRDYGAMRIVIGEIGAVIGSHSGPGALAIFYLGKARAVQTPATERSVSLHRATLAAELR